MEDKKDPKLNGPDALHAENNLLKLKLEMEHGMQELGETHNLSPEVENQWLKQVYAFEQQYKDSKPTPLYEYLGRPQFLKWDTLTPEQTSEELKRIQSIMAANDVVVDCICPYDDAVIYKFITEELFLHETDDMRIPGMVRHFIYEEFHPNHDYDLRRGTSDFLNNIFEKEWNEEYDELSLAPMVTFSGKPHDRASISSIIKTFQESHDSSDLMRLEFTDVIIDTGITSADVRGVLSVSALQHGQKVIYDGDYSLHFVRDDDYWNIDAFALPGMGAGV